MQGFFSTLPYSRTLRQLGSIVCVALFLAACSSGGGDGGGGSSPAASSSSSGTFVDSPVQGLGYQALPSGLVGKTDATGQYQYMPGDMVTFDIGGRVIGTVPGAPQVTALSIFGATSVTDPNVVNLSRLLLTLGGSPNSNNVIVLPSPLPATLPPTLPNFSAPTFAVQLQTAGFPLTVSDAQALAHLQTSFKTLAVTVDSSGTVTSNPAGINCTTAGTCSFAFVTDTVVTLTATGNGFTGWSGPAGCPGTGSCPVTMSADAAVTATFPSTPPPAMLTISTNQGTGTGSVTCRANGGAFVACATSYASGTVLVLKATANTDSSFTGWTNGTGNAFGCNNTFVDCSMPSLNADSAVTANFVLNTQTFTLSTNPTTSNGGGGSIACSTTGVGPFGNCASSYNAGTDLTLQATPDSASNFTGWSANVCNGTGLCQFTLAANSSITANFNRPRLTAVLEGIGTVTSNPPGIDCPSSTCTAAFNKGPVTLTANGTGFSGWSGGGCLGTTTTCLVTLTDDLGVTASFNSTTYPLRVGPTGRYLVGQNGVPFLMIGESPQALIGDLSEADAEVFLANRKSHGFNTVWINLLCADYTGCHANGTTFDGIKPFTTGSDLSTYDLSTPNEAYFARADRMLQLAAQYGFLVVLDPAETGSWTFFLRANGPAKARAYGQYLGTRYKNFPNLVWMSGNDFQNWSTTPSDDALVQAVALGIKDTDPNHIHTVELNYFVSNSRDDPSWAPIISLNAVYTYYPTYAEVLSAYNQSPPMPVFLVEASYEDEGNPVETPTLATLRRQEYWTALSGATGQLYGNHSTWAFRAGWQSQLDTLGAVQMGYVKALFAPRAWYDLVPDQAHIVVTAGYGTFSSSSPGTVDDIDDNDYVTAARTPNGTLVMAYVPSVGTITVDMSQLSGPATARWYDPVEGTFIPIQGSPFANAGSSLFTTPGAHVDGATDWVLILEVP